MYIVHDGTHALSTNYKNRFQLRESIKLRRLRIAFVFGAMMTVIQQMPVIRDQFYEEFRLGLYLVFGLIVVTAFPRLFRSKPPYVILLMSGVQILIVFEFLILNLLSYDFPITDVFELIVPLGIMIASYCMGFPRDELQFFLFVYASITVIMGISLVSYYGTGYVILEQYIQGISKNQTGPIIGIGIVIILDRLINLNSSRLTAFVELLLFSLLITLGFTTLLVMRNRSGLLAVIIVGLLMGMDKLSGKARRTSTIVLIILCALLLFFVYLLGALDFVISSVISAFTLNRDISDLDRFSAGRITTYRESLEFIKLYPLFGEIVAQDGVSGIPHNYLLNKFVRYGLLGSIPFFVLYISIVWLTLASMMRHRRTGGHSNLAIWLLLISLIGSLFEYSRPYGPGVTQIMVWFMLGQYLRTHNKRDYERS